MDCRRRGDLAACAGTRCPIAIAGVGVDLSGRAGNPGETSAILAGLAAADGIVDLLDETTS
jgi:hypothetical protein